MTGPMALSRPLEVRGSRVCVERRGLMLPRCDPAGRAAAEHGRIGRGRHYPSRYRRRERCRSPVSSGRRRAR